MPLGSLCGDFAFPLAPFWEPWASFGHHFGIPVAALDTLGPSFGSFWGHTLREDPPGGPKVNFLIDVCSGMGGLEFIRGIRGIRGIPGNGP